MRGGALIALTLVLSCDAPTARVVAERPDDVISRLPAPLRERFDSDNGRSEMARALEDKALLLAEARKRGYADRKDVHDAVVALESKLIVQALVNDELQTLKASDEEVQRYYDEHPDAFAQTERVLARRLFVADRGDAPAARKHAEELLVRLRRGAAFDALVKESDGPERVQGGELGALRRDDEDRVLVATAFSLTPGSTSSVVATRGGFSIVVTTQILPARTRPLSEVRAEVLNRLQPTLERRAFEAVLRRLRAEQH